ncbi:MAG: CDP-alcohol phosphatidyltransferase family protein [Nitrospinota bacterium]|nr:CDP-alcohol phosphatidyltransferase family protein [Nitrospinota bacterium]
MVAETEHVLKDLAEPVNIYIHEPIAKRLVSVLKNTFITPNQVTYLSVLVGFASGYSFSQGNWETSIVGGILLELTLILDCVDGQLARTKNMASDWGRLIDGIAGYFAYLAVVLGILFGYPDFQTALIIIAIFTILRAISYDYCKQTFGTIVLKGYDGMEKDIQTTLGKIHHKPSTILILYFYYMQTQQMIFRGKWNTLNNLKNLKQIDRKILDLDQRQEYFNKLRNLLRIWRWNGLDFPLFLIALLGLLSMPGQSLNFLAGAIAAQFILTYLIHIYLCRKLYITKDVF